jgi:UDP-N-acetylglucosamine:LPS N-acetylglucosamine transferase
MGSLLKFLFVLGSGGHSTRGIILSKQMKCKSYFIVPWESEHTKKRVKENYFSVVSPRFRAKSSRILTVIRTLFLFIHSIIILLIVRPDVVISTGSGISLPPFLVAKALRFKTVFVESPSRVYKPSIAGKMLLGKTTLWLSSWEELAQRYLEVDFGGIII